MSIQFNPARGGHELTTFACSAPTVTTRVGGRAGTPAGQRNDLNHLLSDHEFALFPASGLGTPLSGEVERRGSTGCRVVRLVVQ